MLTGRKYRLRLTSDQSEACEEFGNICRAVWNTALEQRREYRRRGAWMARQGMASPGAGHPQRLQDDRHRSGAGQPRVHVADVPPVQARGREEP
ncbi:helix-turn-helix domain-containing protein [Streptomyces sp. NPDC055692]|uniref:helix-turn-helix domain-containing protein n=1 Tax=Streptomyces sp. NPDC055692 TaxID=3155683 RepID=UPI003435CAA5